MILGEPWGLLALAGLPAVVALHLWRARHAPLPISALFLWPVERRVLASGRTRAPLVLRPSFWCEVLAVLAAAWWLADLHWSPRTAARHLVLVLDDRWRLQAAIDGSSAADRLRSACDARLAALDAGDRATLIASGQPPRLLAGPAAEPAAARAALAQWRPGSAWHDADAALTLAAGLGGPAAEIILGSDRLPGVLPDGVGAIATGRAAASGGLAEARWWRDGGSERIVAAVYGDTARVPRLEVAGVVITGSSPRPGLHVFERLPPLAEGATAILALPGSDPLPLDDRIELLRPPPRRVRLRTVLEPALAAPVQAAARAAGAELVEGTADIVIGDGGAPGCWSLRFAPGAGPPTLGPFTARRDHPLLADVDAHGALWTGAAAAGAGEPLLVCADGLLIGEERRGGDRDLTIHLDVARSTLTRHTAWPALFANLVAWRAAHLPGVADPNPRAGAPPVVRLPAGIGEAVLADPDGAVRTLHAAADGALAIPGLPRPGRWTLSWTGTAQQLSILPLDPRQGDLAGAATGERAAAPTGRAAVERRRGPLAELLPIVLMALAALGAWLAFAREERT